MLGGICVIGPEDETEPSYVYREVGVRANPKPNPNPNPNTLGPPDRDAKLAGGKQRTVGAHGAVRAVALLIG